MALEGSLQDFGLADILQLIAFQKKTGALTISGRMDKVCLMFSEGNIVSAESKKRMGENRLGNMLLKKGLIKEGELKDALEKQRTTGAKAGDILLTKGLIGKEDLKEALVSQVTETVVQLFTWKDGTYEFRAQPVSVSKEMPVILDTQHLLMEGLRIVDEWSLIEGKITLDSIFKKTGNDISALPPEEKAVLEFVEGENDVSIIIDLCGKDDFETSKLLVSLLEKGIIEPVEVSPVMAAAAVVPAKVKPDKSLVRFLPAAVTAAACLVALILTAPKPGFLKMAETASGIGRLRFMAEAYKYKNDSYPDDLSRIGSAKDAWGNPLVYNINNENLTIISAGPDAKAGTADDIY